jgi:hypothetical protein
MKKRRQYVKIVRSCITGKVVWVYRGLSQNAARLAYWRACQEEIRRVRDWAQKAQRRKDSILRVLEKCSAALPLDAELSREQKEASRELQAVVRKAPECHSEFYDHIMETRRRRQEDREIRRRMRERDEKERESRL